MSISKFLDPKNDIAFKKIFGTEKNKDILIHFLNDVLKSFSKNKIETVSFLNPTVDLEAAAKMQSIVDVQAYHYIVQTQVIRNKRFKSTALYC